MRQARVSFVVALAAIVAAAIAVRGLRSIDSSGKTPGYFASPEESTSKRLGLQEKVPERGTPVATSLAGLEETPRAQESSQQLVVWESSATSKKGISAEVEKLYVELYRADLLPTEEVINQSGGPLETLMRTRQPYGEVWVNKELNQILCRLNPRDCRLVGSRAQWATIPGAIQTIPAINFTLDFYTSEVVVGPRTKLETLVRTQAGCELAEEECTRRIEAANGMTLAVLRSRNEEIRLPYPVLRAEFALDTSRDEALRRLGAIRRNLVAGTGFRAQAAAPVTSGASFPEEGLLPSQRPYLQLIKHPMIDEEDWRSKLSISQHASILITDNGFFRHCDLENGASLSSSCADSELEVISPSPDDLSSNHGTLLAGIIASRENALGMLGVNPRVELVEVGFALDDYAVRFRKKLEGELETATPSLIFVPYSTETEAGTKQAVGEFLSRSHFLSVVPAGNYPGLKLSSESCPVDPACAGVYSPKVLTVGAVEPNGERDLRVSYLSAWGRGGVELLAPGKNILSTIKLDKYAYTDGTCQASALVAGAASLIKAQDPELKPREIEERLFRSASQYVSLMEAAEWGVLNVERSLSGSHDVLKVRNSSGRFETLVGKFEVSADGADIPLHFPDEAGNPDEFRERPSVNEKLRNIVRIANYEDHAVVVRPPKAIFTKKVERVDVDGAGSAAEELRIRHGVTLGRLSKPLVFLATDAENNQSRHEVLLEDIWDYTRRFSSDSSDSPR